MIKNAYRFVKIAVLISILVILGKIFIPRHYTIPPSPKRNTTTFLELPAGPRIACTVLKGKGIKKPYPIIYLHGGPGGAISDRSIALFSNLTNDGYTVFLYDQVGSGESARLPDIKEYTVKRHIDDLHAIIQTLGAGKAILIGQSWGGVLAAFYTGEHPEQVEKIIFTNPGPLLPTPAALDAVKAPDSLNLQAPVFTNAQGNARVKNIRTAAIKYAAIHFGIKLATDNEADEFITYAGFEINQSTVFDTSKIEKRDAVHSVPRTGFYAELMTMQSLLAGKDRRPALKNSNVPVLVIKSQYDNQKWGWTNEYLQLFPRHQLVIIPNAGHAVLLEQPDLYLKTLQQFLHN